MDKIKFVFHGACYLATLSLFIFGIYKFSKNEDLCETSFKSFNADHHSSYPSISLCFANPFNEEILEEHGLNKSTYISYLIGKYFDEKMLKIDYNKATYQLKAFIKDAQATLIAPHFDDFLHVELNTLSETTFTTFNSIYKCITVDMPSHKNSQMFYATLAMDSSMFTDIARDYLLIFNYPKQMLRPWVAFKWKWPNRSNYSNNILESLFTIRSIEMLHRRNKASEACNYYPNYDDSFRNDMMEKIGCQPPYWTYNKSLKLCNNKENLRLFASDIYLEGVMESKRPKYIAKPCVDLQRLAYNYDENDISFEHLKQTTFTGLNVFQNDSVVLTQVDLTNQNFKEIRQVRAFGIESLIGNIGGYIGLFLGASIIQLPQFCKEIKQWLRSE